MKKLLFLLGVFCHGQAFSETLLVVNKSSHSVSLLDPRHTEHQISIPVGNHPHEVAVSNDGLYALVSHYGTDHHPGNSLSVIDIENQEVKSTIFLEKNARPHGIYFISEEEALVTAEGVQSLFLVDIQKSMVLRKLKLPGEGAHLVTVDTEKNYAYVSNNVSGTVTKVNLNSFSVEASSYAGSAGEGIALLPRSHRILITNRKDHNIAVFDSRSLKLLKKIDTGYGPIRALVFDNGKKTLITNCISGTVEIIDNQTLQVSKTYRSSNTYSHTNGKNFGGFFGALPVPVTPYIDESTQTLWVANSFAGNIALLDLNSGKILKTFETQKEPDGMAMSPVTLLNLPKRTSDPKHESAAIQYDVIINSDDIEKAWSLMTDWPSYSQWNPWVEKLSGGAAEEGTILKAKVNFGSMTLKTKHKITRVDAPHTFCWKDVSWFAKLSSGMRCRHLEIEDGHLILKNRFEYLGPLQKVIDLIMRNAIEKGMIEESDSFKKFLESES